MWTKLYGMITLIITYIASAYSLVKRSKEKITYQEKFKAVLEPSEILGRCPSKTPTTSGIAWTPAEQQHWRKYVAEQKYLGKNPAYKSSNGF